MHKKQMAHAHPLSIFLYLTNFLYLLLIPLLRGLTAALTGGLLAWLSGAWVDLLILFLIVGLACLKWDRFKYYMDETGFHFTSGIVIHADGDVPISRIASLSLHRQLLLRPFGVVKARIDTIARGPSKADFVLYLSRAQAEAFIEMKPQKPLYRKGRRAEYRPHILELIALSLFTSNSLIGVLFIAAFISQTGKILGRDVYGLLLDTFGEFTRQLALSTLSAVMTIVLKLPPITAGIAVVLLAGWLLAFSRTLLQTKNLCTTRTRHSLRVRGGVLVEKDYRIRLGEINYIDVRQSLLTRFFRLYSVFLDAVGFYKEGSDLSAIIPFSTRRRCQQYLRQLLPEYRISPRTLKPNFGAIMKFLLDPFWPCFLIPAATLLGLRFFPNWSPVVGFCGLMLCFPAYWFLGVRIMDFASSGVSKQDGYYTLRYSSGFYLHTVVCPEDKIARVSIRQSILQRPDGKCDLKVYTRSEGRRIHHLRNLDWDGVAELFDAEDSVRYRLPPSLWDKLVAVFQPKKKTQGGNGHDPRSQA